MAISKHDKKALADLFIHMGVPLVVALQTVERWSGSDQEDSKARAEKLSKLLAIAVEFATKITKKMEIRDAYTLENVRGKIIRIVTPIIADHYVAGGDIPTSESLTGLTDLFDVLLSFADSVSPTDEKGSKPTKMATMIEACDPLLAAIRDNDLGLGAETAFQNSVAGLKGRAEQMSGPLGLGDAIDSGLFKSILTIYVSCYKNVADNNGDIDAVWRECDGRLALIYGLTSFVAEKAGIPQDAPAEPQPEKKETPAKAETETPKDQKNKDDDDDNEGDDSNPMSFFAAG